MEGRLENTLKTNAKIKCLLNELPDYVTEYYNEFKHGRQPKACYEYIMKIRLYLMSISSEPKSITVDMLTMASVVDFIDSIMIKDDGKGGMKETSTSYRNLVHSVLSSFFSFMVDNKYVERNFMDRIKRSKGKDKVVRKFLTVKQMKDVLNAVDTGAGSDVARGKQKRWRERDKALLMLFMQTGMRETAVSEINAYDIDLENRKITGVIEKGHKHREFSMSAELTIAMRKWINKREELLDGAESDALFITYEKNRLRSGAISDIVKKYTLEATGTALSPHKLRRSYANMMLEATGGNIYMVQQLLGHARPDTTEIYLNADNEKYNEESANIVSKTLFS